MAPVAEPAWASVKKTYEDSILTKLRKDEEGGKAVTKKDRLDAIEYWMDRLLWDAVTTQQHGKP